VQQKLFDDQLTFRGGKMDVGDFMDVNRFGYYNFVGYSFAHNFAIPLPGNPLAGMFTFSPNGMKSIYFSGAAANGAQSSYRAGFEELENGPRALFTLGELGFKTKFFGQDGVYRFEGWYDARDLPSIDGADPSDGGRAGVAISFDQNITKQFGVFARYGYGNQHEFTPMQYLSAGFDWFGPIPSRPKDDFAIGMVENIFSNQRNVVINNASDNETYIEAYYNAVITKWAQVQPFAQVVANPGGTNSSAEVIAGVHVALRF
jgi:carbohydrate-selective porin OprB